MAVRKLEFRTSCMQEAIAHGPSHCNIDLGSLLSPGAADIGLLSPEFVTTYFSADLRWRATVKIQEQKLRGTAVYLGGLFEKVEFESRFFVQRNDGELVPVEGVQFLVSGVSEISNLRTDETTTVLLNEEEIRYSGLLTNQDTVELVLVLRISAVFFDVGRAIALEYPEEDSKELKVRQSAERNAASFAYLCVNADSGVEGFPPCDFQLTARGGRKFMCHRFVLSVKLPQFMSQLTNKKVYSLRKTEPVIVAEVLNFIYTNAFSSKENFDCYLPGILKLSVHLQYSHLESICVGKLMEGFVPESTGKFLSFGSVLLNQAVENKMISLLKPNNAAAIFQEIAFPTGLKKLEKECEKILIRTLLPDTVAESLQIASAYGLKILGNVACSFLVLHSHTYDGAQMEEIRNKLEGDCFNSITNLLAMRRLQPFKVIAHTGV